MVYTPGLLSFQDQHYGPITPVVVIERDDEAES